jgi:ABC-type nitrate/sulfonate/bicarbonate transport system substrate-binding protein
MRKWKVSALRNWLAKLLSLAVLLGACGQPIPPKAPLTPVTVQLTWQHQVEFAGFYAADQLG